jgi:hypothetical protein
MIHPLVAWRRARSSLIKCRGRGRVASIAGMNIRLARAVFLFLLAMSLAFALRETLMVLGL